LKVLLSFVGKQDPISEKTNEVASVITLSQKLQPEIIYLFPSAEGPEIQSSTEENASMTKDLLENDVLPGCKCYIRPLPLRDPTDYQELLPCVKDALSKVLNEILGSEEEPDIHANCSSGTPQMKACWLILANSGYLPATRLWQVHDPKFVKEEERVCEVRLNFLEEENIISRIHQYLPEYLFEVISAECHRLQEMSVYSNRRILAGMISKVFQAYSLWDLLQYREAYQKLSAVEYRWSDTVDAGEAAVILKQQVEYLKLLEAEREKETPENLVDIYYNAERCLARKNYTDTLARFWRIYEGTVYYWYRTEWGIEPLKLDDSENEQNKQKIKLILSAKNGRKNHLELSLATDLLLNDLQDNNFKGIVEIEINAKRSGSCQKMSLIKLLEELREKRNKSVAAHGMRPVTEEDAVNSLTAAKLLLSQILPSGQELLDNYPLQKDGIEILIKMLSNN